MDNWIEGIIKGSGELVDGIGKTIDGLSTSDEEKLDAKSKLSAIVLGNLEKIGSYQRDAIVTELKGNWLQRSWRPILMLLFGFIVLYAKFIAPAFGLPNTELDDNFWALLEIGIGGYVIGRSVEKVATKVTDNIDLSMIKKKNRKIKNHE